MPPTSELDQEFLPLRAKLIEIGAALDRLDRVGALDKRDPRVAGIGKAVEVLLAADGDRAERIQVVFSRPYDADWRSKFEMTNDE